jgi:hypothetical protein
MGMTAGLYRASEAEIRNLLANPGTVGDFIERSTWAPPVRTVRPPGLLGWLLKLTLITIEENDPTAVPPADFADRPHCDLETTWAGLHFLFTGTAWDGTEPACYLLRGGEDIGDADELGYSVLHALNPARTRAFATFLESLTHQELEQRFDAGKMMALGIYQGTRARTPLQGRSELGRLLDSFDDLQTFVGDTVRAGDGLVGYVG